METIIFTSEIKGHFLEYIHHIYELCSQKDGEYLFYVPEEFNIIKDRFLWIETSNIKFEFIPKQASEYYSSVNFITKAKYINHLLKLQVEKYNAKKIFCCFLMEVLPYAPFILPKDVKISGIVYMIYLYRWREFSLLAKLQNILKYLLMTLSTKFDTILILNDAKSSHKLNKFYKTKKFVPLPDPYVPLLSNQTSKLRSIYGISADTTIFAHFGALNENKGTLDLLDSIMLLPEDIKLKSHFFIAGRVDEEIKDILYYKYNQLEHKANITLIDEFCSYDFLKDLCMACDALVIPYKRTSQSSGVIGYASQFGKPVIAPNRGLLGELVNQYKLGITIEDTTPASLIKAYIKIIDHDYSQPSNNYCKDHTVEQFKKVISNCI